MKSLPTRSRTARTLQLQSASGCGNRRPTGRYAVGAQGQKLVDQIPFGTHHF